MRVIIVWLVVLLAVVRCGAAPHTRTRSTSPSAFTWNTTIDLTDYSSGNRVPDVDGVPQRGLCRGEIQAAASVPTGVRVAATALAVLSVVHDPTVALRLGRVYALAPSVWTVAAVGTDSTTTSWWRFTMRPATGIWAWFAGSIFPMRTEGETPTTKVRSYPFNTCRRGTVFLAVLAMILVPAALWVFAVAGRVFFTTMQGQRPRLLQTDKSTQGNPFWKLPAVVGICGSVMLSVLVADAASLPRRRYYVTDPDGVGDIVAAVLLPAAVVCGYCFIAVRTSAAIEGLEADATRAATTGAARVHEVRKERRRAARRLFGSLPWVAPYISDLKVTWTPFFEPPAAERPATAGSAISDAGADVAIDPKYQSYACVRPLFYRFPMRPLDEPDLVTTTGGAKAQRADVPPHRIVRHWLASRWFFVEVLFTVVSCAVQAAFNVDLSHEGAMAAVSGHRDAEFAQLRGAHLTSLWLYVATSLVFLFCTCVVSPFTCVAHAVVIVLQCAAAVITAAISVAAVLGGIQPGLVDTLAAWLVLALVLPSAVACVVWLGLPCVVSCLGTQPQAQMMGHHVMETATKTIYVASATQSDAPISFASAVAANFQIADLDGDNVVDIA